MGNNWKVIQRIWFLNQRFGQIETSSYVEIKVKHGDVT